MGFEIAVACWLCSICFLAIGLVAVKRRKPMHFLAGTTVAPEEVSDIPAFNKANFFMWSIYAVCMAIAGVLSLFSTTVGIILFVAFFTVGLVALGIVHSHLRKKYKSTASN